MAGLALIYNESESAPSAIFSEFLKTTAANKRLEAPLDWAKGGHCLAAKLDGPCSLHRGLVYHSQTGAWLLAAGTLIDPSDLHPDGRLERLLCDYLDHGTGVLTRLDGQFALAIYNPHQETLSLISDPFGLIPIYYGQVGKRWYVSTSALAIAKALNAGLDLLRARSLIQYGDLLDGTLWQDIHILPPATVLTLSPKGSQKSSYWTFEVDPEIARFSEDQAVDCMLESFSTSMRRGLGREGKMWVSLTGGLDSRTLVALTEYSGLPFKTYCHGPRDSRDVQFAERISRAMGWEYEYFPLPEDWGRQRLDWLPRVIEQTNCELNVLKMTRTIREQTLKAVQMSVSLWGYGGELYRGVYWKQELFRTGVSSRVNYNRLFNLRLLPLDVRVLSDGERWNDVTRAALEAEYRRVGERQPDWQNTVKLDLIGLRMERHDCGRTVAAILGQQRVPLPFYFKENLRLALSINYRWRMHSRLFRTLLERINPKLAGMEIADGGPALPMRLSNAYRFIPYWLDTGEKLAWTVGTKYLGRPPWRKRNQGQDGRAYPIHRWVRETVSQLAEDNILQPDTMCSASLYQPASLQALLDMSQPASQANETLFSRIIAVEMAMRLVEKGC